ncbi:efflux RND transporter periplasmic adaptor subunit, partial [Myxococcota bacterium]|nr:efflux RND transporter periplasmic adaptor subunit [Myxococcota bacterium]
MKFQYLLIFLLIFPVACKEVNSKQKQLSQEETVTVLTSAVKTEALDTSLTYRGTAMPWDQVILSFKSSGRIKKLVFEEGDLVTADQYLGSLNEIDYWLQRRLADINVKTLKPDYERVKTLSDQNAIPGAEKERMAGRFRAAKTQLLQAESMLYGTVLRSPMTGIVVKKMVTVGDLVSPARPVGVILNLSKIKIVVVVPEVELFHFRRGVPVIVTVDALGITVPGKVHRIAYTADEKTRGFPVTVAIDNLYENNLPRIRAGMLATIVMKQPDIKGVFLPFEAVMVDLDGNRFVFINDHGRAKKFLVTVGKIVKNRITITSGLTPGMEVIVSGHRYLREGTLLRPGKLPGSGKAPEVSPKVIPAPVKPMVKPAVVPKVIPAPVKPMVKPAVVPKA